MNLAEQQVVEKLIPQLEADGFTVYIEPSRTILPTFMRGYIPDAIALRRDKNIAFEIISRRGNQRIKEEQLQERFKHTKDWELRIIYAPPANRNEIVPASSVQLFALSIK